MNRFVKGQIRNVHLFKIPVSKFTIKSSLSNLYYYYFKKNVIIDLKQNEV